MSRPRFEPRFSRIQIKSVTTSANLIGDNDHVDVKRSWPDIQLWAPRGNQTAKVITNFGYDNFLLFLFLIITIIQSNFS
jgi:hypothetical protein